MVIIGVHFERTVIICHFNLPITPQLISFQIITVSSFFIVWVLDNVYLFAIIYITFLGYFMNKILDDIEVWCHWPVSVRVSWLLKTPESIIVGFLLEFSFVWLHPISNAHIVALVPFPFISFDIILLEESYEALLINITTFF